MSESAVGTIKSKRGWSFKFRSLKKGKKKKENLSLSGEKDQQWTGIGAQGNELVSYCIVSLYAYIGGADLVQY